MPLFGGLRANSKYDEGTKLLNGLERMDDPTTRRDTLRRAIESLTAATELKPDFGPAWLISYFSEHPSFVFCVRTQKSSSYNEIQ